MEIAIAISILSLGLSIWAIIRSYKKSNLPAGWLDKQIDLIWKELQYIQKIVNYKK